MSETIENIIKKCKTDSVFLEEMKILLVKHQMYKEARDLMLSAEKKEIVIK